MGRQKLGQHFLVNREVAKKIVENIFPYSGNILEIGPGKGVLTELIAEAKPEKRFIAVEKDRKLYEYLKKKLPKDVELINNDILKLKAGKIFNEEQADLVSNVPYNISREFIDWIIARNTYFPRGILMMQKEFYLKMVSSPDSKGYNPQSIIFNMLYSIKKVIEVKPGSFSPPPKVNSTVFYFEKKKEGKLTEMIRENFYIFLKTVFHNRRKTLSNNLGRFYSSGKIRELLFSENIPYNIRGEQLEGYTLFDLFVRLTEDQDKPEIL